MASETEEVETKEVVTPRDAKQGGRGRHAFIILISSLSLAAIAALVFLIPW